MFNCAAPFTRETTWDTEVQDTLYINVRCYWLVKKTYSGRFDWVQMIHSCDSRRLQRFCTRHLGGSLPLFAAGIDLLHHYIMQLFKYMEQCFKACATLLYIYIYIYMPTCHLESNDLGVPKSKYPNKFAKTISVILYFSSDQSQISLLTRKNGAIGLFFNPSVFIVEPNSDVLILHGFCMYSCIVWSTDPTHSVPWATVTQKWKPPRVIIKFCRSFK